VTVTGGSLARFTCEVQSAHVDDVSYAKIATGIVFSLVDQPLVLARWREVLGSIRQP
jgi:hypothetical protein